MPRIDADAGTLAEHVERQEAAVFAAAMRLFLERGYAAVTLADVAAEVGLKRNSLYRYFPDKAHILVRWLRRELPEQAAESRRLLRGEGDPGERLQRWAAHQLDYARRPEHGLVAALPDVARDLDDATRAELADSHRELLAPLDETLAEAGLGDAAERDAAARLLWGLVMTAAEAESAGGGPDGALRERLRRGVAALVS